MDSKPHILLVEDDRDLSRGLIDALQLEGYPTTHADDGPGGLRRALSGEFKLVILDVMLPGLSGFDVLKKLRKNGSDVPVILLTARGQEVDKVRGLRMGADDYVTKPFGVMELLARVEAQLRRAGLSAARPQRLELGEAVIDFSSREAWRQGEQIALTGREFEILQVLAEQRGKAVSRADLIARIWGIEDHVEVTTRTIDQHVASLRRKVESNPSSPDWIETVYGYGYRLAHSESPRASIAD